MTADPLRYIALLGRRDQPTDALEDYCRRLAQAFAPHECTLEIERLPWAERGWRRALREVHARFATERGHWVLVQYTALAWSRCGFPLRFASLIDCLRRSGVRILLVLHEPEPFGGKRAIDRLRRRVQSMALRRAARSAEKIVSTFPPESIAWMRNAAIRAKTTVLPVGSNFPAVPRKARPHRSLPTVVVFGWSNIDAETECVAYALSCAAKMIGPLHFTTFGRGTKPAAARLRPMLDGTRVELEDLGIVEPARAAGILAGADVQLFVRSGLAPNRGSAIAGIVCGLPIVGFSDDRTEFPMTEVGARLVSVGDRDGLVRELVNVLQHPALREELRQRNLQAASSYFCWDRIADVYLALLGSSA